MGTSRKQWKESYLPDQRADTSQAAVDYSNAFRLSIMASPAPRIRGDGVIVPSPQDHVIDHETPAEDNDDDGW